MKHSIKGDTLTVLLEGDLDHHNAELVRTELESLIVNPRILHLILDLRHLSFMDSSGIGVVLGRYRSLAKRRGSVAIRNSNARIDRIFSMSGLYQIVEKL